MNELGYKVPHLNLDVQDLQEVRLFVIIMQMQMMMTC